MPSDPIPYDLAVNTCTQTARTPREQHAHLLEVAAARRLRAAERQEVNRLEDASYWKAAAPCALRRARSLRENKSFAPLPA